MVERSKIPHCLDGRLPTQNGHSRSLSRTSAVGSQSSQLIASVR